MNKILINLVVSVGIGGGGVWRERGGGAGSYHNTTALGQSCKNSIPFRPACTITQIPLLCREPSLYHLLHTGLVFSLSKLMSFCLNRKKKYPLHPTLLHYDLIHFGFLK